VIDRPTRRRWNAARHVHAGDGAEWARAVKQAFRLGLILARMRIRRLVSMLGKRKGREGERLGTQVKQRSWITLPITLLIVLFSLGSWGFSVVREMMRGLGENALRGEAGVITLTAPEKSDGVSLAVFAIVGAIVTVIVGYQACLQLGNKDVGNADWDVEWFATLPIPRATVTLSKIIELTATSWVTWSMAAGVLTAFSALFGGLVRALLLLPAGILIMAATGSAVAYAAETWMRLSLRTSTRQNIQATLSVVSVLILLPVMGASGRPQVFPVAGQWLAQVPAELLPGSLLARSLVDANTQSSALCFLGFCLECAVIIGCCFVWSQHLQRDGITKGGSRVGVRATPVRPRTVSRSLLTPIQRRDLLLLRRDKNLLVQVLVLPMVFVGQQLLFNANPQRFTPPMVGFVAFVGGAYTLLFSGLQLLVPDGKALWLTLAQPISIEQLMREKVKLIGSFALSFCVVIAGLLLWRSPSIEFEHVASVVLASTGIVIYTGIAGALGVFAYDATAIEVRQRIKQQYALLYLVLIGFFSYAILAKSFWQQLVVLVLSAMLSLALWQKARDLFPFLFDPSSQPELPVAASDGILALIAYFVLQGLLALFFALLRVSQNATLFLAAAGAGLIVFLGAWFMLGNNRRAELPRFAGGGTWLLVGATLGPVLGVAANWYLGHARAWFDAGEDPASMHWSLIVFAVIIAPLFEEYIFRGLLLTGLKRQLSPVFAILASAALFAVVHPPLSIAPVFALGVGAAVLATRSKRLLPGVVLHFSYNATIVFLAMAT
jgi:ABC-2 type transport system permease protein